MFPMTVTISNKAQLDVVMQALAAGNEYAQQKAIHAEPEEKNEKPGKKAGAAQTADKTSTTTTEVAAPAETAALITYDDVAKAIIALSKEKGRDAAVAVLTKLGVAKATDLKMEQYANAIAAAKAALGGE